MTDKICIIGATFFAPSSLNRPEAKDARFICLSCAKKRSADAGGEPIETRPFTDEQRREYTDRGFDPDAIQGLLDDIGVEGILDLADPERAIDLLLSSRFSRPTDEQLADMAKNLRAGLVVAGPQITGPAMPAISLLTIIVELIELRAKVRT